MSGRTLEEVERREAQRTSGPKLKPARRSLEEVERRQFDMRTPRDPFRVDPNGKGLESFVPGLAEQAGDFAHGAVMGAGKAADFMGSMGGLLPNNAAGDGLSQPSQQRVEAFAAQRAAMGRGTDGPLSPEDAYQLLAATPEPARLMEGPSGAEQLGEQAGVAASMLIPETLALRAIPALTRAVPMLAAGEGKPVRNFLEKVGEDAVNGTFGQSAVRQLAPTMGAVGGSEVAGELTDDSALAQLAGGLAGGMGTAIASTYITEAMRNGLSRWMGTSRHDKLNEALAGKLFVKQMAGDTAARKALAEWDTIERTFGPDTGLTLGQVSGGVKGGPAASRTRSLAAMNPPFEDRVLALEDKAHAFVAQYIRDREPSGAMFDVEKRAQLFADERLEPIRQQMKMAESTLMGELAGMPSGKRSVGQELSTTYAEQRVKAYEGFQKRAKELYDEVEKFGGVEVPLGPIDKRAQLVMGGVTEAELRSMGQLPMPLQVVAEWSKAGKQTIPLSELEGLKRAINGQLGIPGLDSNQKHILGNLRRGIDDALEEVATSGQFGGTPEAADAFRGADKFYREGKTIFDPSRGGEIDKLRDGRTHLDSYLSRRIDTPQGQQQWLGEIAWMKSNGQGEGADAMEQVMENFLLHEARFRVGWDQPGRSSTQVQKDFAAWMDSRKTILENRYQELGMKLADVSERARIFDQASDDLGVTIAGVDRHMAGVILGDTPGNAVARVLNPGKGISSEQALAELQQLIGGNIAANRGMKRGIYDYITRDAFEPVIRGGADVVAEDVPTQLSNAINRRMRDPKLRKLMEAFYTQTEMKELEQAFRLSQLSKRRMHGGMTRPGSKADVAEFEEATGQGATTLHSANPLGILNKVGGDIKHGGAHWMRGTDPKAVSSIFQEAFIDPVTARRLIRGEGLSPGEWENNLVFLSERLAQRTRRIPAGLVAASAAEIQQRNEEQRAVNTPLPDDER